MEFDEPAEHIESPYVDEPRAVIQAALDYVLPGNTSLDTSYDTKNLIYGDKEYNLLGVNGKISLDKMAQPVAITYGYRPKITTGYAPKRPQHTCTYIPAVIKRNLENNHYAFSGDYEERARKTVHYAMNQLCVSGWEKVLENQRQYPIMTRYASCELWASAQTPEKLARLKREHEEDRLEQLDLSEYSLFLRATNKTPSDQSIIDEVQHPQTVVFSPVLVNAHYGPMMRELEEVFLSILKPNVLYNKAKNQEDIESFLNNVDVQTPEHLCKYFENDMSKYDKSQHIETFYIEKYLFWLLGLDEEFAHQWFSAHWQTKVVSRATGFMFYILFQRKSGDVTTSFGNTVINMITTMYSYKIEEFVYALFLGDDSLIKFEKKTMNMAALDLGTTLMMSLFNLQAKYFLYNYGYFCGWIVTKHGSRNALISDAIRRGNKLGRSDIANESDFKEHWISFRDVTRNYDNDLLVIDAQEALAERYTTCDTHFIRQLYWALNSLSKSYKEFRRCWEDEISIISY